MTVSINFTLLTAENHSFTTEMQKISLKKLNIVANFKSDKKKQINLK